MQLLVLGMHRSGTSVLARMLNLMGAYFGPEGSSTGANAENPKGFWERRDIRNLNDQVLHAMKCDWNRLSAFDPGAIPRPVAAEFTRAASRVIHEMDAHRPWLMKEPRLCLLYPLWRPLLEVPICIHILRHPAEVASSLMRRNAIPMEAGLALWELYVRAAIRASVDDPTIIVSHHQLMTRPEEESARLFDALKHAGVPGLRRPAPAEVKAFVDPDLYRERLGRDDLREYQSAPQVALFSDLLEGDRARLVKGKVARASLNALRAYEAELPAFEPPAKSGKQADGVVDRELGESLRAGMATLAKQVANATQARERADRARAQTGIDRKYVESLRLDLASAVKRVADISQAIQQANQAHADAGIDRKLVETLRAEIAAVARQVADATNATKQSGKERVERVLAEKQLELDQARASLDARSAELTRAIALLEDIRNDARKASENSRQQEVELSRTRELLRASREATRGALEDVARQVESNASLQAHMVHAIEERDRAIGRYAARADAEEAEVQRLRNANAALEASVNARLRDMEALSARFVVTARAWQKDSPID